MTDIFLSYNREDQARAKLFAEAFEGQGYRVWWDVGLRTGEAYDEVTEAALRQARAVVVLWSKRSAASRWVRAEATLADRNRTLVPCMIEPCERPIMFELTQTAELSHWWGDLEDPAWRRFLDDLRLKFGDADPPAPIASPPLAGGPAPQAAKPPPQTNLATGGAALIGRAEDSAALCAALKTHRLVTISGPGGGGKSRLANAVAWLALPDFPDGVWWVELAPVIEGALVADAIARSLGLTVGAGLTDLVEQIKDRRMLLVLDNCEHVIAAAAEVAEAIISGAANIHVMTTSQERLRSNHEHTYRLAPLATPASGDQREGPDSLDLFAERARAASPGFELTPENLPAIAQICRQLDGLPLAIELAAARLPLLGLDGLRQRLEDRFRVLGNASRTAPARQRTLRAALEWSHGLLSPAEQTLFARLGVFAGWFDLEALEQVCSDAVLESWEVIDIATSLLDKSLLTLDSRDPPRYRLLETPRAFAIEQLDRAADARAVRARHAGLMRARLLQAQEAQWTPAGSIAIDRVVQDIGNLRSALTWAAGPDGDPEMLIALAGTGSVVWTQAGAEDEGLTWCETALGQVTDITQPALEAELLVSFAKLSPLKDAEREVAALERAAALFAAQFDRQSQYIALGTLSKKLIWRRDLDGALAAIGQAEALLDPRWPAAIRTDLLQARTYLLEIQGRPAEGEPFMLELLAIMRALGDPEKIDLAMVELAENYMVQGKFAEAADLRQTVQDRVGRKRPAFQNLANLSAVYTQLDRLEEALACARAGAEGLLRSGKVWPFLDHFALMACKRGRLADGARMAGSADYHFRASGFEREMSEIRSRTQIDLLLRAAVDIGPLQRLYEEGSEMPMGNLIQAVLGD